MTQEITSQKPRRIGIYFNVEEYNKLQSKAVKQNISFGKFVKNCAVGNNIKVEHRTITKTDPKLLFELNKIGCNINQIARQLNKMENMSNFHSTDTKYMFNNFRIAISEFKRDLLNNTIGTSK